MTNYPKTAYGPAPTRIRSSATLRAALGEPPPLRSELGLEPYKFWDGTVLPGGCSPLLRRAIREMDSAFERHNYRLDGRRDDWCWNRRPVRGGKAWSMHSWGTAVDINAAANPYSYSWRCDMPPPMVAEIEGIALNGRPVWAWGGRFGRNGRGKTDTMHFQLNLKPSEARIFNLGDPVELLLKGDDMLESFINAAYGGVKRWPSPEDFSYWWNRAAAERPNRGWTYQDCLESPSLGLMVALLGGE